MVAFQRKKFHVLIERRNAVHDIPVLRFEECFCIPKKRKLTLPSSIIVPLTFGEMHVEQEFALQKVIIDRGYSPINQRIKKRLHIEFDAHGKPGQWTCFLTLYDVAICTGGNAWDSHLGCLRPYGRHLSVKQIAKKVWDEEPTIVDVDRVMSGCATLLGDYSGEVGLDEFNAWLGRMTLQGEAAKLIAI